MFYYFNIYICRSSPYFCVCDLGISNTHVFSSNGIVELTENIIQDAYVKRDNLHPGSHYIIQNHLVNPNRILHHPLYIKLGL